MLYGGHVKFTDVVKKPLLKIRNKGKIVSAGY
jgi:hypothetical protein